MTDTTPAIIPPEQKKPRYSVSRKGAGNKLSKAEREARHGADWQYSQRDEKRQLAAEFIATKPKYIEDGTWLMICDAVFSRDLNIVSQKYGVTRRCIDYRLNKYRDEYNRLKTLRKCVIATQTENLSHTMISGVADYIDKHGLELDDKDALTKAKAAGEWLNSARITTAISEKNREVKPEAKDNTKDKMAAYLAKLETVVDITEPEPKAELPPHEEENAPHEPRGESRQ